MKPKPGRRLLLLIAALIALQTVWSAAESSRPTLIYFFENYCDACHPEVDFIEQFHALTGQRVEQYAYSYHNVRFAQGRALFDATAEEYGLGPDERFLPMVVVNGTVYSGNSKLETALPMDFLENESTDSLVYYLYSPACESCARAERTVDALPESVRVRRGGVEFDSAVAVRRINIYEDPSTAQALFRQYRVPESRQITPIAFLGEDYVDGAELIESRLPYMLNAGLGIGTPLIAAAGGELPAFTVPGTALAGLVAGFNPCALSMLLLFLSLLLNFGERAARRAAVYLAAKLVTYVAIGTAFLSLLSAWNPTWLPRAAKLLLTVVGGVLIVLNLCDAWSAWREKYGEIKNQLPRGLRGFLDRRIRSAMKGGGAPLTLSIAALGVVVASGEFLCSGQLYLANLTAALSAGAAYGRQLALLLLFCLAFLLPSVVITVIVVRSKSMFSTANAILRGMPLIKLASAAAMLVIILAAWFLL